MSGEQITTLAELEALPPYSIVLDCDEVALRRAPWGGWTTWYSTTTTSSEDVMREGAPLVVLYRPDAEGARRGSARALSARAEVAEGIAQAIQRSHISINADDDPAGLAARIATEYGQGGAVTVLPTQHAILAQPGAVHVCTVDDIEQDRSERADLIERALALVGEAWDDGNGTGLDGWVGPGRGAGEVDREAQHARTRMIHRAEKALDEGSPR